jgi:hypothetical protein
LHPIKRRLTNLSEYQSQKDDSNLPRFSKRNSNFTKPNFSFSSGASGLLASFNSSAFKNTLKIESTKDPQNVSLGNILEELDEKEETPQQIQKKKSHLKRHSLCVNSIAKIQEESETKSKKRALGVFPTFGNNESSNNIKIENQGLSALSEKSKSDNYKGMKLKEESVQSSNQIQNETTSIKSEKPTNYIIKPKVIRIKNFKDKRKSKKIFQSMEGKTPSTNPFPEKKTLGKLKTYK